MNPEPPVPFARELIDGRERFLNFVDSRLHDRDLAEDILQDSLLRALKAAPALRDESRFTSWFYAILRNAITDAQRKHRREAARSQPFEERIQPADEEAEAEAALCECFRELLPSLRPEYAELVERLDLQEQPPASVAEALGITRNNLKVRHHRARQALRARLEETCRVCADHGCLDCSCEAG
jgi:RNA polymerase sigma-70 factor (ECF subfamily)